jgi:nucleotide-binding universal stress UspA family protein
MSSKLAQLQRILVATDFSSHSKVALSCAVELARLFQSQLKVVHCLPDFAFVPSASEFGLPFDDYMLMQRDFRREAVKSMEEFLSESLPKDVPVSTSMLMGNPPFEISEFAEQEKANLVVVGRTGQSGWGQFLLGSTSRGLVNRCPCSVLSVNDDWTGKPKTILVGTDFSDGSRTAVEEGVTLAEKYGAELHLLHVIDTSDTPSHNVKRLSGHESMRKSINDYAQSRLETFVQSLKCTAYPIKLHLNWGTPWRDMCQLATTIAADLIIVGNVGRRGMQGIWLGNTSDKILTHSKLSVLAVK